MTSYKNSNGIKKRIILDIVLLTSIFYMPWWVVVVLSAIIAFLCPPYYEIIVAGVLIDVLYGASSLPFGGIFGTLGAVVIFFVASYTKKAVR